MPLPEDPIVTAAQLKAWAKLTTVDVDDPDLVDVAAAVDEFVRGLPSVAVFVAPAATADGAWPGRYSLGAKMLAARLYRRRNSPEGVASFTGEGVLYVRRTDPDVAELLRVNFTPAG